MAEQASRAREELRDGPLVLRRYAEAITDDLFEAGRESVLEGGR